MAKKVIVLMGGVSFESKISIATGEACCKALQALGYDAHALDIASCQGDLINYLKNTKPDVVFNALHGPFGEDGTVQAILEYLGIAYTHSGVLASALAMDKAKAKTIAKEAGVHVAPSMVLPLDAIENAHPMEVPYVLKPLVEGSSAGVIIVKENAANPAELLQKAKWNFGHYVMVEKYIPGREFACGVMGDKALDVCEIIIDENYEFYDVNAKYVQGGSKHICPAKLLPNIYENMQIMALKAHKAIGCKGVSRSDFRYDHETGEVVWLEINTQPGMTPTSLLPEIAEVRQISFNDLVRWIVEDASCKR